MDKGKSTQVDTNKDRNFALRHHHKLVTKRKQDRFDFRSCLISFPPYSRRWVNIFTFASSSYHAYSHLRTCTSIHLAFEEIVFFSY